MDIFKDERYREASDAVYTLIEAFPEIENELMSLISSYILKKIPAATFDRGIKLICIDYVKGKADLIKKVFKTDKRILNAFLDVTQNRTHVTDAAIKWDVSKDILGVMLRNKL